MVGARGRGDRRKFLWSGTCGLVVSGCAACRMKDERYYEMRAGDLFYIGPGHDSWVVGDEPYVSLHFLGAEHYAQRNR
jgi:mannose-6-phosphate isomerase-like protein (cupin superfamily)